MTPALDAIRIAAALLLACSVCTPVFAQTAVDLQLVLAVDASGSVDQQRFELQKQGYVAAFRDPRVLHAIQSGAIQAIAVTMVQWTGPDLQMQVLPWTVVKDATTAHAFADAILATPRQLFRGGTSISGIIDYAVPLILDSQFKGTRRVIDISGDGSNNRGRPAANARDDAVRAGIIINGLPILALEPGLERYYYDHVIGGLGAFVIAAESYETFADAILKKLIREMAAPEHPLHAEWYVARPPRAMSLGTVTISTVGQTAAVDARGKHPHVEAVVSALPVLQHRRRPGAGPTGEQTLAARTRIGFLLGNDHLCHLLTPTEVSRLTKDASPSYRYGDGNKPATLCGLERGNSTF